MLDVDDAGWVRGLVSPLHPATCYSLFAPARGARVDAGPWAAQAARFFGAVVRFVPDKRYAAGTAPLADVVDAWVGPAQAPGALTRVRIVSVPLDRAPEARAAAERGVRAIGGAGFDVLLTRARQVWQVASMPQEGDDERAPLVVAGVLASTLLAPIVPPEGDAIFGVKGARTRLEERGWRS